MNYELDNRFDYHKPDETKANQYERIRALLKGVAAEIDSTLPEGREKSLVITKLEEAMFWAIAGIARS